MVTLKPRLLFNFVPLCFSLALSPLEMFRTSAFNWRDGKGRANFLSAGEKVSDGVDGIGLELSAGEF